MNSRAKIILDDLNSRIEKNNRHKIYNRHWLVACYLCAIIGSLLATVAAAIDYVPKWTLSFLSAIPAASLTINSVFRFELKEKWHHDKVYGLSKFKEQLTQVTFSDDELTKLKKEIDEFDEKLKRQHPSYGKISSSQ